MMPLKFAILTLLLCFSMAAQTNNNPPAAWPHPFIEGQLDLNGNGYTPVTLDAHPGLNWETARFSFIGIADYSFARKTNDGTLHNDHGHSRTLQSDLFFKVGDGWLLGGGAGWNKTYTTNYDKIAYSWRSGGGKDFLGDYYSARLTAQFFRHFNEQTIYPNAPGCACSNDLGGVLIDFWQPSPSTAHHWFFHTQMSVDNFRNNPGPATRYTSDTTTIGVLYRF